MLYDACSMRVPDFRKNNLALYQLIAGIAAVTLILVGCITVLKPFFPAALLALIFALATWPAFIWLTGRLKGNTARAAILMSLLLTLCFVAPLVIIGTSIADNYSRIYTAAQESLKGDPAATAVRLRAMPYGGDYLARGWEIAASDREHLSERLEKYSGRTTEVLLQLGKTVGSGLLDVTLGVIIAYFLFRHGTAAAARAQALIENFGGEHGSRLLDVCKKTLISVVYGLLGTALAQGAFATLGFWLADVPGPTFLGLMVFFFSLLPMGPPLIWGPAAFWLFSEGRTGWAVFMVAWGILVVSMIDTVMKPWFVSRGSNLPLLLVLLGIMGGVLAFGFIGLFIGPTLLALAYSLLLEWSTVKKAAEESSVKAGLAI
jgi:predicted PurR-regulated permease PerM